MIQKIEEYIATHPQQLAEQIAAHIGISLFALFVAALIGIPCGCLAAKLQKGEAVITAPFEMLRVVPSLAVLILLIPIMGTGVPPAVTALTILAVPPVLLNTIVGFRTIPDFMIESARGIGMTEKELFWRVKIPCALPMVLAGLRTAPLLTAPLRAVSLQAAPLRTAPLREAAGKAAASRTPCGKSAPFFWNLSAAGAAAPGMRRYRRS